MAAPDHASDGGIAVSRTVNNLTADSTIQYEPMGTFDLKHVRGEWDLYEVLQRSSAGVACSLCAGMMDR